MLLVEHIVKAHYRHQIGRLEPFLNKRAPYRITFKRSTVTERTRSYPVLLSLYNDLWHGSDRHVGSLHLGFNPTLNAPILRPLQNGAWGRFDEALIMPFLNERLRLDLPKAIFAWNAWYEGI